MVIVPTTVQDLGADVGVLLPPEILAEAGLAVGDEIVVIAERRRIVISPRESISEELLGAAEGVLARYDGVFRKLPAE